MAFMRFTFSVFSRIKAIALTPIDIRDLLYFIGLGLLSYGLYLIKPYLAFIGSGVILMVTAYMSGGK